MLPNSSFSKAIDGLNKPDKSKRPLSSSPQDSPHQKEKGHSRKKVRMTDPEEKKPEDSKKELLRPVIGVIQQAKPQERPVLVAAFKALLRNRRHERRKQEAANRRQNEAPPAPVVPAHDDAANAVAMDIQVIRAYKPQ